MSDERYLDGAHVWPEAVTDDVDPFDGDEAGGYCTDCPGMPFVPRAQYPEHDALHVERAAQRDPNQAALL